MNNKTVMENVEKRFKKEFDELSDSIRRNAGQIKLLSDVNRIKKRDRKELFETLRVIREALKQYDRT